MNKASTKLCLEFGMWDITAADQAVQLLQQKVISSLLNTVPDYISEHTNYTVLVLLDMLLIRKWQVVKVTDTSY